MRHAAYLLLAFLATPLLAQAPPDSATVLEVVGLDGAMTRLPAAQLATLPQASVRARFHDGPDHVFRGPTVQAVLAAAGAPFDRERRREALTVVVLAEAADGYRVAYALAEFDAANASRPAIVALGMDDGPLEPGDGAARLLIEGEPRASRWIRQLVRLRLIQLAGR